MSAPTLTPASTSSKSILPATGSAGNVNKSVPYKVYSDTSSGLFDSNFLSGAISQVTYVFRKLGGDVLDIELSTANVYSAYEEAVLEYSYILNIHQANNSLSSYLGHSTGSFDHLGQLKSTGDTTLSSSLAGSHAALKFPKFDFGYARRATEAVAAEIGLGRGNIEYSASIDVKNGVQDYDLQQIIEDKENTPATGSVTISDASELSADDTIAITAFDGTVITATATAIGGATTSTDTNSPTFALHASAGTIATNLATALNGNSKLVATAADSTVTVIQSTAGGAGNTTITLTDSGTAGMTKVDFANGSTLSPFVAKMAGNKKKKIIVKQVFYKTPQAMWRFYGYYGGLNVVGNLHNYGQFSDTSTFELIPAWQNKLQAKAFEDAIYTRMSHFSYELKDNKLRLFPIPYSGGPTKMWVKFSIPSEPWETDGTDTSADGVSNMNNLPFANLPFRSINSIGKQWIRRFALALCKEMLGQVRSKFATVPIPGESVTLNGSELISQGREEQDKLRTELKETLTEMTYTKLAQTDSELMEATTKIQEKVPLTVFVG